MPILSALRRPLVLIALMPLALALTGCGAVVSQSNTMQIQMAIYTPLCLEVADASTAQGEIVQTYPCVVGERRQEWTFVPIQGTSFFNIANANSLDCMTVSYGRSAPGTPVIQIPCYLPAQTSQEWKYLPAKLTTGGATSASNTGYTLVSAINNLCLDIPYGETTGESPLQVYTCTVNDPAQAYTLTPVAQGTAP